MGSRESGQMCQGTWKHTKRDRHTRSLTRSHEKREDPERERTSLDPDVSCSSSLNCL